MPALLGCAETTGSITLVTGSHRPETSATTETVVGRTNLARQADDLTRTGIALVEILRAHESENADLLEHLRRVHTGVFDKDRQLRFGIDAILDRVAAELGNAFTNAVRSVSSFQTWNALRRLACEKPPVYEIPNRFFVPLLAKYDIHSPDAVKAFLLRHPVAVDALRSATTHIDKFLAPLAKPTLELTIFSDEEGDQELTVLVPTDRDAQAAMAMLDKFDEKWWLDQPDQVRCMITFDMELR